METSSQLTSLIELLRGRAQQQPEQLAYVFLVDGEIEGSQLTYGELDSQAQAIAVILQHLGAMGERVLLLYPPGLEFVEAFFGCLYAGAVAVPAYPPRRNRSLLRLQTIVADSGATVALTTASIFSQVERLWSDAPELKHLRWITTDHLSDEVVGEWQKPVVDGETLAFLQYTSGSTSAAKGVMVSHGNLLHNEKIIQTACSHTKSSTFVGWLPLYHDMGLIGNVLQPLFIGAPCVLMSPVAFLQRPFRWLAAISRYRAATSGGPNFAYDLCVRRITPEQRAVLDLSSWRTAFNGAEPIRHETMERFAASFKDCGFRRDAFYPCYGLAEATLFVTGRREGTAPGTLAIRRAEFERHEVSVASPDAEGVQIQVSCGQTFLGQKIVIADPDSLTRCPSHRVGEIWLSGQSVAHGYWNNLEESERTFHAYLADSGEGPFLRTGDLGFLHAGELFITGRLKDLIIIRGRNHYPQDIEWTVESSHAELRPGGGAAFSVDMAGEERLVCVQEVQSRRPANTELIMERIRQKVAEEHEIQIQAVVLVETGTIPKTSSGKIQRRTCRSEFLNGNLNVVAEWHDVALLSRGETPASPVPLSFQSVEEIEAWLQSLLAAKLGIDVREVDVESPITRYGVDSLIAVELVHNIETESGVTLPMSSFLQGVSLSWVARQVFTLRATAASTSHNALVPAGEDNSTHPLSHGQRSLFFLYQLNPQSPAYNIARAARIDSAVDVQALRRSSQALVNRHPVLRTVFAVQEGIPVQQVREHAEVSFEQVDAAGWSDAFLNERMSEESHRPFELEHDVLLRVKLFTRASDEHVLLLTVHHIASDFWSLVLLVNELGILYAAESGGKTATLAPLTLQYTDYARWQAAMLAGIDGERLWSYWQKQLAGDLPVLNLPTVPSAVSSNQPRGGTVQMLKLQPNLAQALEALAQAHNATLYMTLLAALQVLLYRYTGQEDILVGSPTTGRNRAGLAGVVGYFVNPVILRAELSGAISFENFLDQVRETVLAAFEHQDYPFGLLVEHLQPNREAGRAPLLQVMFVMQKTPLSGEPSLASFALGEAGARLELGGLVLESVALEQQAAQFDLTLTVAESDRGLTASLQYSADLFDDSTAQSMLGHFQTLLESIVAAPDRLLSELSMLTVAERKRQLVKWREAEASYPHEHCLHELFEAQVERTPDAVAVVCEGERLTYRELNHRANRLAHHLRGKGVRRESLVGVLLNRSLEMVVGILGILKAGGAYVPLDASYPGERLSYMLTDAGVQVLLTEQRLLEHLSPDMSHVVCLDSDAILQESTENPTHRTASTNLAYVIYTSGSTGKPKGTLVCHANVVRLFAATQPWFQFNAEDVWTLFHSVAFDFSVWELWGALLYGGRLVVVLYEVSRSPEAILELLHRESITVFNQTPSAFRQLMRAEEVATDARQLSLRLVIFGGEALDIRSLRAWFERHGDVRPQLVNMYGITETTVHVTYRPLAHEDAARATGSVIGGVIPDLRLYILDSLMEPLPVGIAGEMYVGGAGVARGYLGRPELTAERFVPDPFNSQPGARLYRTGDLARLLPDGDIEYLGRIDEQVKIRGFRIELGEIEATLRQHPSIREAVVVVREDVPGDKYLTGYLVTGSDALPPITELRSYLKAKLPEYMVPPVYVRLDAIPLTPHGKVNRRALPAPPQTRPELHAAFMPPRNEMEKVLAEVWGGVLGIEHVGIQDNFFDLGGDSIRSIQVRARAQERGLVFSLEQLFRHPTIRELVEEIKIVAPIPLSASSAPFSLISQNDIERVPRGVEDAYPLTKLQTGLIFLSEHSQDYESYVTSLHLRTPLDTRMLQAAAQQLAALHPMLRTSFDLSSYSEPIQLVHDSVNVPFSVEDWRHIAQGEQEALLAEMIEAKRRKRFDWNQPPLFGLHVHRRGEETFQLTLSEPFLDGWSVASLLTDLFKIYFSLLEAQESSILQPPKAFFRDYVALEKEALSSDACRRFWMQKMSDCTVSRLPRWPVPAQSPDALPIHRLEVSVPSEVSAGLRQVAHATRLPLKSVLLAAHLKVMSFLSGQDDVVTGLLYNGRPEVLDGERILGLFLNVLPFRLTLPDGAWTELVKKAFDAEQESMPYRRYPLAELQRQCGGQPLFETAFNFTHFHVYHSLQTLHGMEVLEGYASDQTFFDLTAQFNVDHNSSSIRLSLDYRAATFSQEQMTAIGSYYNSALAAMSGNPLARHNSQSLLSPQERNQLVDALNDTVSDYPRDVCLHEVIEAQVERTPDATAVIFGSQTLTYRELNARANRLAHHLRARGSGRGVLVGICVERSLEMLVGLLGILKSGGAYVPLDPEYPQERLAFMLKDARAHILLTQEHLAASLPAHEAQTVYIDSDWTLIARESEGNPARASLPENLAYVIYTSGSTGKSKGVQVPHRAVVNFLHSMRSRPGLTARDTLLAVTTLSFDIAALEIFLPLAVGARVVLASRETTFDGARLLELLLASGTTVMQATPATWRLLLEAGWQGNSHFKILCGGEALTRELANQLLHRGGSLWNLYGPTETTIWSAACRVESTDTAISIGRPLANTQLYVLDRHMQPVPPGVPGELHIGGHGLSEGYLNRPELTAETFILNPFGEEAGSRLYKTGDIARYLPGGDIEILGRLDHQVKVRGHRIELGEIETVLGEHPAVREVAVLATQDTEAHRRLVAYVVLRSQSTPAAGEFRNYLQERLPRYMLPAVFIVLKAMPLTPNGKIDRKKLPPADHAQPEAEQIDDLLRRLEHLSDEEVRLLLSRKKSMAGS